MTDQEPTYKPLSVQIFEIIILLIALGCGLIFLAAITDWPTAPSRLDAELLMHAEGPRGMNAPKEQPDIPGTPIVYECETRLIENKDGRYTWKLTECDNAKEKP
jgi:hypothetical protein